MEQQRFLRIQGVMEQTGLARSSIYALVAACRFPRPVKLSVRSSGWLASEVDQWLSERVARRDHRREAA